MDRKSDIRGLMNLMESAIQPVVEAPVAFDLAAFTDEVIDFCAMRIKAEGHNASNEPEALTDQIVDKWFRNNPDFYKAAIASGWPKDYRKEWKHLQDAFKAKFGKSMQDFAYEVEDKAYANDAKSIKKEDKPIWNMLSGKLTVKATPRWAKEYLMWYKMSAGKVVVQDEGNLPEAVFGPKAFAQLGITIDDFIAWLGSKGIEQIKKPKRYKSAPPMYD